MNNTFPIRLKQARLLAKLSLRELSERANLIVSYNAIKKYEDGKMMPEEPVISALAKALAVSPDYFFKPSKIELTNVEFRKRAKLTAKEISSIKERVKDHVERYLEVESILHISQEFVNPLANKPISSIDEIENTILQLLKEWNLGYNPIPNVIEMLEEKGIKIVEIQAPLEFDGLAAMVNSIPVIVLNKAYTPERKRLTALHELGHIMLKLPHHWESKEIERCCHRFASAMLVSKPVMQTLLGKPRTNITLDELISIKEQYGISIQAIVRRAKDLEIINDYAYKNFFIWISKNRKEEGLGSYKGEEKSYRFNLLLYRIAAEELVSLAKAAALGEMKIADLRTVLDKML
ncbi:helix-turn-helix domain-containing protein [Spirosoma pollinicola]|uniref:HTH cro/C1-type domain-containing protein n=1 Tax=Spirosoma pollinicola TaxID=2057025 RepID=A0A2K8Z6C4_9BACT|nr:XRE family transcriptional regulator [Spirosoma pollinicola]AUD05410.1 hypothetical protein CWM47_28315 [Spirosoma pollinicola]RZK70736.1 MAG: helix-turn-helix domain-containing protein [Pedobacter sp.]